jgi:hypothetical protein
MSPTCTALKIISTIENISFILYVYYCHLNHLFCQILVGTPTPTGTVTPNHVCTYIDSIFYILYICMYYMSCMYVYVMYVHVWLCV